MIKPVYVYTLSDPTTGQVRYVGKTQNPHVRLQGHCSAARKEAHLYKAHWIRSVLAQGGQPVMTIVEECSNQAEASVSEKRVIAQLRQAGAPLTNGSVGGEAGDWSRESAEWQAKVHLWRERIGAASRRAWQDPDFRQRMLATFRAPEYREALAARTRARMARVGWQAVFGSAQSLAKRDVATRAYKRSPEGRAAHSARFTRLWQDPAYREKMVAERRARGAAGTAAARVALALALEEDPRVRERLAWWRGRKRSPEQIAKQRGEGNASAKLTAAQVEEMRAQRAAGARLHELARLYGVHTSTVGRIVRGQIWSHVSNGRSSIAEATQTQVQLALPLNLRVPLVDTSSEGALGGEIPTAPHARTR